MALSADNVNNITIMDELQHQNHTLMMDDIIHNSIVQVMFLMVYTVIFVLGILGNALVCYVVFRNKAMQTVTNLFITNLALSDIWLCVFAVPFTPLYTFLGKWVFGSIICHLLTYVQAVSVYISTLTLTSIAIDRFFVIIYPFHPRMKLTTCLTIIVVIWIFSILVTLPYGVYTIHYKENITDESEEEERYFCEEKWPSEGAQRIFGGMTTVMQFVIPFLIMAFCYICVFIKLNDKARLRPGCKNSKKEEADRERKRRTNRMLVAMVAIFLLSWLPLNLMNIINDFYSEINWDYVLLTFFIGHAIAMSSTCYNPFLYAWLNENFRKEFKQVFPCFENGLARLPNNNRWRTERCNETQVDVLLTAGHMDIKNNTRPITKDSENALNNVVVYDSIAERVKLKLVEADAMESNHNQVNKNGVAGLKDNSLM